MSSTSTTQYYGLTQYVGTDKPDFADNNVAFRNVDAALHGVVQDAEGFATDITNLQTDVAAAQSDITTLQTDLDTAEAAIVTINNKDLAQDAEIARVDTNSKDMITAYNEASATSTHAYAIGDYFIYNNVLYRAIAAIAIGDTIVPDTNCTTTNVGAELIQLNSDLAEVSEDLKIVTADGVKTVQQILNEFKDTLDGLNEHQLIRTKIDCYGYVLDFVHKGSGGSYIFSNISALGTSTFEARICTITTSSDYRVASFDNNGTYTYNEIQNVVPAAGTNFILA